MDRSEIYYSPRYQDDEYEYRHVILPRSMSSRVPSARLMSEVEWRRIGVQQSVGWVHYMIHDPERHVLLFRRPIKFDQNDAALAHDRLKRGTVRGQ
ncbi:unnamed protein product [Caenorhabditis auriculariae]|uniref:Cyclin-dependent kinases regulatory subunit n=1 Tax=Caenorhabditis auriculariae TaxID=2777116 RepID=A0A8S1HLD0_9PELO|nr:unnamed protein product [Caenorhabditis auriculariae]